MSFFQKLSERFDDLSVDDRHKQEYSGSRDSGYSGGPGSNQYSSFPPQHQQYGYTGSGPGSQYSSPPPQQSYGGQYSSPPPQHGYGAPPQPQAPEYRPPQDKPPLPHGWIPQWDNQYQRWYYVEQASGRSQWEAPGYDAPIPGMPATDDRGYGHHDSYASGPPEPAYGAAHGAAPSGGYGYGGPAGYGGYDGDHHEKDKSGGHGGMLLGAAGGLAVGAIGGAVLANALDDSSDDEHHGAPPPVYAAPEPARVYYGDDSDRESVEEAREEYEQALEDAASSSASSSDREELEEAREEYLEELEEYYDDD